MICFSADVLRLVDGICRTFYFHQVALSSGCHNALEQLTLAQSHRATKPAFLTGTSSEFLGKKPWPRVVRQRSVVVVIGPEAVGKTSVAKRILGGAALRLNTHQMQESLIRRVREGKWPQEVVQAEGLILDGPVWLRGRLGVVELLKELLVQRARQKRRTLVVQSDSDGSIDELIGVMPPGTLAVIGLRFPKGKRGRLRFARRICREVGAPEQAANGTEKLEPWRYQHVIDAVRRWPEPPTRSAETDAILGPLDPFLFG